MRQSLKNKRHKLRLGTLMPCCMKFEVARVENKSMPKIPPVIKHCACDLYAMIRV